MLKGYIRKADIALFIAIMIIGLASTAYVVMSRTGGTTVEISLKGELYGTYSLMEDREITVGNGDDYNTVTISKGKVQVTASNCHNQVCVKHAGISQSGESIICLPHRLVVEIQGGGGYDAVSR